MAAAACPGRRAARASLALRNALQNLCAERANGQSQSAALALESSARAGRAPDEQAGLAIASGLRFAGYAVAICPGPAGHGKCPLTGPAGCAPAHEADLVVCSLGYENEQAREILRELRVRYPGTPLLVEAPPEAGRGAEPAAGRLPRAAGAGHPGAGRRRRARTLPACLPKRARPVRSPFHSEAEAFRFVLLLIVALVPIALAAAFGPTWLVVAVVLVVVGALAVHLSQLRMRRLRGEEIPVKMAPPHVGPASETPRPRRSERNAHRGVAAGRGRQARVRTRHAGAAAGARADQRVSATDRRGR